MAEYYSAELSQKVKRGMNESRQKGTFTGGFIIFGYRVENKKIIIHEDEAEVVRWMFNECASGKLVKTIIEELHEKGILYRGKPFARNTVYHLLANEKYSGIYRKSAEKSKESEKRLTNILRSFIIKLYILCVRF